MSEPAKPCPKCGLGLLLGPKYVPADTWGNPDDFLLYVCGCCGYQEFTAPKDRESEAKP